MPTSEERDFYFQLHHYLAARYHHTAPLDFYRDLFPRGCFETEVGRKLAEGEHPPVRRPNGISLRLLSPSQQETQRREVERRLIFDGLAQIEDNLSSTHRDDTFLVSPVGYSGLRNRAEAAYTLFAIVWDLDEPKIENFFGYVKSSTLPRPTYTVVSGHGLHLYYVFETPVPLYPPVKRAVRQLKQALTPAIWNVNTSRLKNQQFEGFTQSFRMVGGRSKLGPDYTVEAWKTGPKITLQYLAGFLHDGFMPYKESRETSSNRGRAKVQAEEARKLKEAIAALDFRPRPATHRPRTAPVQQGLSGKASPRVYDWWLERATEVKFGHRYWYVFSLAVYAIKGRIPFDRLEKDAYRIRPSLSDLNDENPFTEADVKAALQGYNTKNIGLTRQFISNRSAIPIEPAKRNWRPQAKHLGMARYLQSVDDPEGLWRRHSMEDRVTAYLREHPEETIREVASALDVSVSTVRKYWRLTGKDTVRGRPTVESRVTAYVRDHPDEKAGQVAAALGISVRAVRKYWRLTGKDTVGGRPTVESRVTAYLREHPEETIREVASALDVSVSTVRKYWRLVRTDTVKGRPTVESRVVAYLRDHPDEKVSEIAAALGISEPTVRKYRNKLAREA